MTWLLLFLTWKLNVAFLIVIVDSGHICSKLQRFFQLELFIFLPRLFNRRVIAIFIFIPFYLRILLLKFGNLLSASLRFCTTPTTVILNGLRVIMGPRFFFGA